MNILYLHSHDSGRWMQPYCDLTPSTAIAQFAEGAAVFERAHTASPTCSPSRGCLLTGTYPHENGLTGLAHLGFSLTHPEHHLARRLRGAGYQTILCGIQHEAHGEENAVLETLGYERQISDTTPGVSPMHRDVLHAERAAEFLRSSDSRQRPFFLSVGFFNTHRPYRPAPPFRGELPAGLPDTPAAREDFAGYLDSLSCLDAACGVVFGALQESGHDRDTLVVFTTDHGPAFPGMKCTARDAGTGVALMVAGPGVRGGRRISEKVSNLDLYPTLCEWTGLAVPKNVRGRSLRPLLEATGSLPAVPLFHEINFHVAGDPARAVRTEDFLLIRHFLPEPARAALCNIDEGPLKSDLISQGKLSAARAECELYDLREDPGETLNVAADPGYESVRAALESLLEEWMHQTGDPLLEGNMPVPEGARLLDKSGVSTKALPGLPVNEPARV